MEQSIILQENEIKITQKLNTNNGRWTHDEHLLFLEAILVFGNEWKKVQDHIKTRSSTQARSHAQKFFIKVIREISNYKDFPEWSKENFNDETDLSYDKISKIFKDCLPKVQISFLDRDKLIRFWMNLKDLHKKRKKKNTNEGLENSLSKEILADNNIIKQKVFGIEKHKNQVLLSPLKDTFNDIKSSEIPQKHQDNYKYHFLKLKRDLKPKISKKIFFNEIAKDGTYSNEKTSNNMFSFLHNSNELPLFPSHQNGFDKTRIFYNGGIRNQMNNDWSNELDLGNNKIFNDVDFFCGENKNNLFNISYQENNEKNIENYLNFNVHNSEIN